MGRPTGARSAALALALLALAIAGCKSGQSVAPPAGATLRQIAVYPLSVTEPSDLAIDVAGSRLWTVTNNPDSVYQLAMNGSRVKSLKYSGQDLEGIAYDPSDQTLWVAEENQRTLVHLDLDGNVLGTHPLGLTGQPNSGLEGLCLNDTGGFFALNEKLPGLFIVLHPDKSIARMDTLTFAGDYSGIAYDPGTASFWIVSDQSEALYLWNPTAGVTRTYSLPYPKQEGVAFDPATRRIYVVSDSENKLYVYQYEP